MNRCYMILNTASVNRKTPIGKELPDQSEQAYYRITERCKALLNDKTKERINTEKFLRAEKEIKSGRRRSFPDDFYYFKEE